jgi:hypothetical protein
MHVSRGSSVIQTLKAAYLNEVTLHEVSCLIYCDFVFANLVVSGADDADNLYIVMKTNYTGIKVWFSISTKTEPAVILKGNVIIRANNHIHYSGIHIDEQCTQLVHPSAIFYI